MKVVQVKCWELEAAVPVKNTKHKVYITYPKENLGFNLIQCTKCGEVYASDVVLELLSEKPLADTLAAVKCLKCGIHLGKSFVLYPEKFMADYLVYSFKRPVMIPDEQDAIVKEFPSIF